MWRSRGQARQLTFASSGHLGAPHLAGELMDYLGVCELGTLAMSTTPADFAALIKSDIDKWGEVIRAAKIEVD